MNGRMDLDLEGSRALVTGGSRGIGAAIARLLAAHGAKVGLHCRANREAADRTLASLDGEGHAVLVADLAEPSGAENLVAQAAAVLGGLDILVNNAGIYELHPPTTTPPADWQRIWRRTLAVNLLSPANLMHTAARLMRRGGGGRIVNVSSRGAYRGEPEAPAYAASKAGLNALSQSMAQALAPDGIYVTVVAPGWVETDMTESYLERPEGEAIRAQSPLGRVATADEVARVVLFLASGQADFATGTVVDVNGASYLRS